MQVKFLLDFDGVLFNSAFEAFTVANRAVAGETGYRDDVAYEEFLEFRGYVTDAWQYNRLYSKRLAVKASAVPTLQPVEEDWEFSKKFFEMRKVLMQDPEWPKVMPPYDFFYLLKPYIVAHPDRFAILSTRNVQSIVEALRFHQADVLPVFGQEDIRRAGNKLGVAKEQGWLDRGKWLIVYIDDMNSHLEPFEGHIHLPLHADWGYDQGTPGSLSAPQIIYIISSLLSLTEQSA